MSTLDVTTGNTFTRLVKRIEQALSFDLSLGEIHDLLCTEGVSEEDFFLLYKAAKIPTPRDLHQAGEQPHVCGECHLCCSQGCKSCSECRCTR